MAAGSSTAIFSAVTLNVTTNDQAVVTASLNGQNQTFNIGLAASLQLTALTCNPPSLLSGASTICTVGITQPAISTVVVALSSNLNTLTVPPTATIAIGQSSISFSAAAGTVTTGSVATISGTFGGKTVTAQITLSPPMQLSGVSCSATTFSAAGTSICTVSLTGPALSTATVSISSDNAKVTVPGSVVFNTGQSSVTFTAAIGAPSSNQTAIVTVILNGITRTVSLMLTLSDPGDPGTVAPPFVGSMGHIAAEGNWTTTFTLVNKGGAPSQAQLNFFGDATDPSGNGPLALPLVFSQAGVDPLTTASFGQTVAANASLIITTGGPQSPAGQTLTGSAQLGGTGAIDGFAIFHQIAPLRKPWCRWKPATRVPTCWPSTTLVGRE